MDVFAVRMINLPFFSTEFHFHKECQLVYVVESEGRRIIGDSVENFNHDELILLGPDIPHVWHNDKKYFEEYKHENHARSVALFFDPDKLREAMAMFGLTSQVESLLRKTRRGMKFSGRTKSLLKQLLFDMAKQQYFDRLITFIRMLEILTRTREYRLLVSSGYVNTYQAKDNDRIDRVFRYVLEQFKTDIQLNKAAQIANMSKQAFCRYFKSRTQKTFLQFVNEVRIGHACKLMTDGHRHIASLAYDSGFNNLSSFNRSFKEIKEVTPKAYLKMLSA